MPTELRKTGISALGDLPWGTHFCHFYETDEDLLDILLPYFKTGLENNEFCMWVVFDPLDEEEARNALRRAVPEADQRMTAGDIEIVPYLQWYLKDGSFDMQRVINGWLEKLTQALARGYAGLRVNGNEAWLTEKDWKDFSDYEKKLNEVIANQRMIVLCTYPLALSKAAEIFDVARTHEFAIARRFGNWEVLETPELRQAKAEIKRLNKGLEQRVIERTSELVAINEDLKGEISERQRAEDALRASEERFRRYFELGLIGMAITSPTKGWIEVNDHLCQILGYERSELLQMTWAEMTHPVDLAADFTNFNRVLTGELDGYSLDKRFIRKDGQIIDATISVKCLRRVDGAVDYFVALLQDITERKRAEEALRQAQARIEAVLDSVADVHMLFDRDWRYLYANEAAVRAIGRPREQIIGRTLWEMYPDIVGTELDRQYHRAMEERLLVAFDFNYLTLDTWWENRFYPVSEGLSVFATDITERKRVEEQLQQSEERFRQMAENITEVFWMTNPDKQQVLYVSPAYEKIWGRTCESVYKQPATWLDAIHPDDRERIKRSALTQQVLGEYDEEYRIIRPDGSVRCIRDRAFPINDKSGRVYRVTGIAEDITERKQAEEQLKNSNEELRALSARLQTVREEESLRIAREIHDDLGGALTGLKMELSWLGKRLPESSDEATRQKLKSMSDFIDETMQKVRNISTELRPSVLDDLGLSAAIKWQAGEFQQRTEIECKITSLPEEIALRPEKSTAVFRILQEILTNVARHANASLIEISLAEHGTDLVLKVSDNGRGIKESDIADPKSLGLLGMRERAVVFGGRVEITGAEGRGTTVTVSIPRE